MREVQKGTLQADRLIFKKETTENPNILLIKRDLSKDSIRIQFIV